MFIEKQEFRRLDEATNPTLEGAQPADGTRVGNPTEAMNKDSQLSEDGNKDKGNDKKYSSGALSERLTQINQAEATAKSVDHPTPEEILAELDAASGGGRKPKESEAQQAKGVEQVTSSIA